jgi:hypothetical protein
MDSKELIILFDTVEKKIQEYIKSSNPYVEINLELKDFITWLCTKTVFARYQLSNVFDQIFVCALD